MIDTSDSFDKALQQGDLLDQSRRPDEFDQATLVNAQPTQEPIQEELPALPQEEEHLELTEEEAPPIEPQDNEQTQEEDTQKEEPQDDAEATFLDYLADIAMVIPRGAEAAAEGIYGLGDAVFEVFSEDGLPDWNREEKNLFGTSNTGVGRFGVGLVQFATGFFSGGLGAMSLLGKAGKVTRMTSALSKGKGVLKSYSKKQLNLSPETMKSLSKMKAPTKKGVEMATKGAITEFLVFKGEEERLSNMLATHEGGGGPAQDLINWLAYDPNAENHNEFIERGKLAIEGLIVGEVLGFAGLGVAKGYRKIKPKREGTEVGYTNVVDENGNIVAHELGEAVKASQNRAAVHADKQARLRQQELDGEEPNEIEATLSALDGDETTPNQTKAAGVLAHRLEDAEAVKEHANLTGVDPENTPRPPGVQEAQDNIADAPTPEVKTFNVDDLTEDELDAYLRENNIQAATLDIDSKRAYAKDIQKESKAGGTEQLISSVEEHVVKTVKNAGLYDETNPQAMLSGVRVLNSVTEMRAFLGHMAKIALKNSKQGKMSAKAREKFLEDTRKITLAGMEGAGGKSELDLSLFRDRPEDMKLLRAESEVIYDAMNNIAKDLEDKVTNAGIALENQTVQVQTKEGVTVLNKEEAMTEVYSAMDRWSALQEIWADYGTQFSLGLRQRQDLYRTGQSSLGRDIAGQHRSLGVSIEDAMKKQGELFRRQNRGVVSDKRIVKDLQKLFKKSKINGPVTEGMEQMAKDFNQVGVNRGLSKWTLAGRKGLAVSQEWYYNAILGSPTSWAVNFIGGALVLPLRHIESIAGGAMTGNMDLVKANFRVMFDLHSFADSAKFAWRSGMDDEARSIAGYTAYRDDRIHSPQGEIRVDNPDGTLLREAINWVGKGIRFPSRVMMVGDEFFKQMGYRSRIKTSLAMSGYKKGLHRQPGAMAKHIQEGFNTTITKEGRFRNEQNVQREALQSLVAARKAGEDIPDERDFVNNYVDNHYNNNNLKRVQGVVYDKSMGFSEREELVNAGTEWALVNTFTNQVNSKFFKATGDMAQMSPWLGFVIPFVKTPSNILLFALGRTLPNYSKGVKEIRKGLKDKKDYSEADAVEHIPELSSREAQEEMAKAQSVLDEYEVKLEEVRKNQKVGPEEEVVLPPDLAAELEKKSNSKEFKKGFELLELKRAVIEDDTSPLHETRKMVQSLLDTMQNEGSIQAAETVGRLSTGIMTMGTLFAYIETLGDRITGSAPEDPGKREAWEATGKQAFSIEWGGTWYSYQRLDPFATTLGIMADISQGYADTRNTGVSEFGDEDEFEEKQEGLMRLGAILATAMANNVSNKSYIENLGELLDMLEKPSEAIPNIGGNIVAGFVPNGLNWSQNVYQEEPAILEAREFLDKLRKRIPESIRPGKKLMPRRNSLGEIIRKSKTTTGSIGKGLNPFFSSETSNDIIDMELEHQAVGRKRMSHSRSIGGNTVDYRDYRNENGDTAYDRMQNLSGTMKLGPGGLTLRQALRAKINSNDYQNLPPVTEENRHKDHPRTKALNKTFNRYRAHARSQTEREFKDLRADLANLLR